MKKISIADSVVICLALRAEILHNAKFAKLAIELNLDYRSYVDVILDLIHAFNAVSDIPYTTDDSFVLSLIKL